MPWLGAPSYRSKIATLILFPLLAMVNKRTIFLPKALVATFQQLLNRIMLLRHEFGKKSLMFVLSGGFFIIKQFAFDLFHLHNIPRFRFTRSDIHYIIQFELFNHRFHARLQFA
jgi:hypothetical protein